MGLLHYFSLLRRTKSLRLEAGELTNDYEREYAKNKRRGSGFLAFLVILFCMSDGLNYYSSFNTIYTEDFIVLLVLSGTLAMILNYSNTVIVKFLTADEEVNKEKKRYLWIGTFAMLIVIASILVMLYLLRFSIIDQLFDDVPLPAAQAMTLIWSSIAVGTTICSFGFSCINNLVIIPYNEKLLKRRYLRLAQYLLQKKEAVRDELEQKLQLYDEEHDALKRIHEHNISVVKAEENLLYHSQKKGSKVTLPEDGDTSETSKIYHWKKTI